MKLRKNESGAAIVYILIAIMLFAALGVAVSNMMRTSSGSISGEKRSIFVSEILSHAQKIRDTVKNLQISYDCEDTDLSFEQGFVGGYEHSPAASEECKIFGTYGTAYIIPNEEWFDRAHNAQSTYGEYIFTASTPIDGIAQDSNGGAGNDIALVLNYLNTELCKDINDRVGVTNTGDAPPLDTASMDTTTKFSGSFAAADPINTSEIFGKPYGCVQNAGGTFNIFYYVLVAR